MINSNITYTQQGNYLLPDLKLPEEKIVEIGVFDEFVHLEKAAHKFIHGTDGIEEVDDQPA